MLRRHRFTVDSCQPCPPPVPDRGRCLIYESGCIDSKPTRLPLSIGDGELAETSDAVVSVPEIFAYWLQAGRIDIGFLSGAQLDKYGNINSTVIGWSGRRRLACPARGVHRRSLRRPAR